MHTQPTKTPTYQDITKYYHLGCLIYKIFKVDFELAEFSAKMEKLEREFQLKRLQFEIQNRSIK